MAVGYIDKDFIEEGPFRLRFHSIVMLDPSVLENVKLWFSTKGGQEDTYYMGTGVEKTDADNEVYYDFNADTRRGRLLLDDGSFETETVIVEDEDGNETEEEQAKYTRLKTNAVYRVHVTYTSTAVASIKAVGGVADIQIREAGPIL